MDVRLYAGGQLAEQNTESQHPPEVFFELCINSHKKAFRCTWKKGKMPCVELLEETEPSGWFGKSTGVGYGSRQLTPFMGGLLILKPDSTPARRFQVFKLTMDGELNQLSEGMKEVVRISVTSPTKIHVVTTGPGDPASRDWYEIDVGASVQDNPDKNDEQYPEDMTLRNSNLLRNSDGFLMKKSLTNIGMGDSERKPCKYFEVISPIIFHFNPYGSESKVQKFRCQ